MNFPFESVLQVIAAFAIFIFGFVAIFIALSTCLLAARFAFRGVNWLRLRVFPSLPPLPYSQEAPATGTSAS